MLAFDQRSEQAKETISASYSDSSSTSVEKMILQDNISGVLLNNRYAIQKVIGRGGIGVTYLALDSYQFNDSCVIKEFAPIGQKNERVKKLQDLFLREAKILYQLEHPQIPKFYACFETQKRLFLVQEYIEGKSYAQLLQERVKQGKTFSESEIVSWLKNMLQVLDYIHERGIIHRDISPDNIMQPNQGELPILIDFGVGKKCNYVVQQKPDNPTLVGKIGYASHEQIRFGQCFPCSDLYSLGVSAITLLTGKQPHQLIDYSLEWQWRNQVQVSNAFAQVLDKLIAYHPTQRYQSAKEALVAFDSMYATFIESNAHAPVVSLKPNQQNTNITKACSSPKIIKTQIINPKNTSENLTTAFIEYCQKELAYCIGPMAKIVIKEILADKSGLSKEQFIEAVANNMPYYQDREQFYKKLNL